MLEKIDISDICVNIQANDWEDAIQKSSKILLEKGIIGPEYVDAMINVVKDNGPYIVITKHIALAHAQSRFGVNSEGITFATLKPPVPFNVQDMDPVKLIITLAATDPDAHVDLLGEIAEVLMDEDKVEQLFEADTNEQFLEVLKG